ncbi:MAG: fumarylacetoacetate hydrolase family protein [Planctomycetota bacterium]
MAKYVRFEVDSRTAYDVVEGNTIRELDRSYFERFSVTTETFDLDKVRLPSPAEPSKIVCVGLSAAAHVRELPPDLQISIKPSTAVVGPGEPVVYPDMPERVEFGAELAVVIGKTAHNIEPEEADEYIFGYTCLTDVAPAGEERGQAARTLDAATPVGPWIVDNVDDPNRLEIELAVNEETRQLVNTGELSFDVQHLVSLASKITTLHAGDVIAIGAPVAVGPVRPGDVMEVRIQNIGRLKNPVKR